MTYLVFEDGDKWRISRSDGRLFYASGNFNSKSSALAAADRAGLRYQVYRLFKRVPQELRYLN